MSQSNVRREKQLDEIMQAVERVIKDGWEIDYHLENNDKGDYALFMGQIRDALDGALPGKMSASTADLLGFNDPVLGAKLEKESAMIDRVERALKIAPAWDSRKDPWFEYHKKLVEKESETYFTFEEFVDWWNSDDFRKKQGIWLNPEKIDKFWVTAMSETETQPETDLISLMENHDVR